MYKDARLGKKNQIKRNESKSSLIRRKSKISLERKPFVEENSGKKNTSKAKIRMHSSKGNSCMEEKSCKVYDYILNPVLTIVPNFPYLNLVMAIIL